MHGHKPHILFLMCDQARFDWQGFSGHPYVRTPNLDRLARKAAVFHNAYTPSPICVPGRQCLMTGLFPSQNGVTGFYRDLEPGSLTWARHLALHGYETIACGKLHHQGPDQMQGWTHRPAGDMHVHRNMIPGENEKATRLAGKKTNRESVQAAGPGEGTNQWEDSLAVEAACMMIRRMFSPGTESSRPVCLKVSLNQPHYPFYAQRSKFDYYLKRAEEFNDQRSSHPVLGRTQFGPEFDAGAMEARRAIAAYSSMMEEADEAFGKVLQTLQDRGQNIDDWLVVFTSDHGEMLGEHGIWEKTQFYESSVRVPLFIRHPRSIRAGNIHVNTSLVDLFPTFCEATSIPVPGELAGKSLWPLLQGGVEKASREPAMVISEYHPFDGWLGRVLGREKAGNLTPEERRFIMLKKGDLKYCHYGPLFPEVLFDLAADPGESCNVISDPRYEAGVSGFRAAVKSHWGEPE